LEKLQDAADIVFKTLGQLSHVLSGKQLLEIVWTRWKASHNIYLLFLFEDSRDLVTRHDDRNGSLISCHPFHQPALSMGVRSVDLVQNQTEGFVVSPNHGRDASGVATGLDQPLHVVETPHRLTRIDFERFHPTASRRGKSNRRLPDSGRSVKQYNGRVGFLGKVGCEGGFYGRVSDNLSQEFGAAGLTPHT
jgi:hypothetical protein